MTQVASRGSPRLAVTDKAADPRGKLDFISSRVLLKENCWCPLEARTDATRKLHLEYAAEPYGSPQGTSKMLESSLSIFLCHKPNSNCSGLPNLFTRGFFAAPLRRGATSTH